MVDIAALGKPVLPNMSSRANKLAKIHCRENAMIKILLIPVFVIALTVPFFNKTAPALFGFPFFYWSQTLAVPVSSLLIFIVFRAEDGGEKE